MPELGFFGKIPAKADFVRHNVTDDASRSFEQWVQESHDALRAAHAELPAHAVRVVFTPPGSARTVIAVLVPSRDQVGRTYPLVLFAHMEVPLAEKHFSTLPVAWGPFLEAAVSLGTRAAHLELDALRVALDALPRPREPELSQARAIAAQTLAQPLVEAVHRRLFGGAPGGMHLYAYQTFLTACQNALKSDSSAAATVLDCPIRVDVDLFVWLELARRAFGFPSRPPSYFWIEDPAPRLLLSLGLAPLTMLQLLANPELTHQRLWPLTTARPQALETAQSTLGPVLAEVGEHTPLSGLMDTLSQHAAAGDLR